MLYRVAVLTIVAYRRIDIYEVKLPIGPSCWSKVNGAWSGNVC